MGAWRRLACYPQSTFYPFSDGSSIRNHRITISNFRSCSTCLSYSQAPLCYYTLHTITIRIEGTFEILRYTLGGDRPSQTTRLAMSPLLRVRPQTAKGRYFNDGSNSWRLPLRSLPPILHIRIPRSMLSYSKGSWGLSVPL